jgi:mutator protein MutT
MSTRNVALILFTDGESIIIQERGDHSKVGEKYGFIGGGIEDGETKEEAIKREAQEELGFVPEKLKYIGTFPFVVQEKSDLKGWTINQTVFVSPITEKIEKAEISEGKGLVKLSRKQIITGKGFPKGSTTFLKEVAF